MTPLFIGLLQKTGLYRVTKKVFRSLARLSPSAQKQKTALKVFYSQFIKPGDVCFDIGANVGDRTAAFLNCGATVIAVDPQPVCVEHLNKRFANQKDVTLVEKALGDKPGEAEMLLSDADTISSLSPEWIESVKKSGRFSEYEWNKSITVPVTTMDGLIKEFGTPAFCKIDVEGYELQVLQGLTQPMNVLSFEFTPEYREATVKCIERLKIFGKVEFNYSIGETVQLALEEWLSADTMINYLNNVADGAMFGDVYARFK